MRYFVCVTSSITGLPFPVVEINISFRKIYTNRDLTYQRDMCAINCNREKEKGAESVYSILAVML